MNIAEMPEDWPKWTAQLLDYIAQRDAEAAANVLVQCLQHEEMTRADLDGHNAMFQHPEVLKQCKVLWMYMEPMLVPEFVQEIRGELVHSGWDI